MLLVLLDLFGENAAEGSARASPEMVRDRRPHACEPAGKHSDGALTDVCLGCRRPNCSRRRRPRRPLLRPTARARRRWRFLDVCSCPRKTVTAPAVGWIEAVFFAVQKWSKGKMKEKVNNAVLFDKVRCGIGVSVRRWPTAHCVADTQPARWAAAVIAGTAAHGKYGGRLENRF